MRCLILAGGFGTRARLLTNKVPKPLLLLGEKPIITYITEKIPKQMQITVSTNKKFEVDFLEWRSGLDRNIDIFVEEEKLGALRSIDYLIKEKKVDDNLLVIAGDNYFKFTLSDFIDRYNGKDPLVAVCDIKDKDKARDFGVVRLKGRKIVAFDEKPCHPASSLIAIACYILPPTVFRSLSDCCAISQDNLGDFIAYLVETGKDIYAYLFEQDWFDIGTAVAYEEAKRKIELDTRAFSAKKRPTIDKGEA